MDSEFKTLTSEQHGHVAVVRMDNPPVNAITQEMYRELRDLFTVPTVLGADVRVVVLGSAQRHFCAGNDLAEFADLDYDTTPPITRVVREAFEAVLDCDMPVVGMVHGAALGSGVALSASCDVVVASDDASFGLPEIGVGVMGGARHLARLLPQPIVRSMFLTGDAVGAELLHRHGGVLKVVPRDTLLQETLSVADSIARHSPVALRYGKKTLNRIESMELKAGYELEQEMTREMTRFEDSKEALAATREGRRPQYVGR